MHAIQFIQPKYGEQNVEGFDGVTTFHHPDIMDFIER